MPEDGQNVTETCSRQYSI